LRDVVRRACQAQPPTAGGDSLVASAELFDQLDGLLLPPIAFEVLPAGQQADRDQQDEQQQSAQPKLPPTTPPTRGTGCWETAVHGLAYDSTASTRGARQRGRQRTIVSGNVKNIPRDAVYPSLVNSQALSETSSREMACARWSSAERSGKVSVSCGRP